MYELTPVLNNLPRLSKMNAVMRYCFCFDFRSIHIDHRELYNRFPQKTQEIVATHNDVDLFMFVPFRLFHIATLIPLYHLQGEIPASDEFLNPSPFELKILFQI